MRVGHMGAEFKTVGSHILTSLSSEALLELFICYNNPTVKETARIWDVHIDQVIHLNKDP
jgi:hypothetical protein